MAPGTRPHPGPLAGSRKFRSLLPEGEGARGDADSLGAIEVQVLTIVGAVNAVAAPELFWAMTRYA